MGHMIEQAALSRGHNISCVIDAGDTAAFDSDAFRASDVAIEFSQPHAALSNCVAALSRGVSVVSGTTGWADQLPTARKACLDNPPTGLMWSSNYSIGVALFRRITAYASRLMSQMREYTPALEEVHHIHKLDHPSGTAITLAETVIDNTPRLTAWAEVAHPQENVLGGVAAARVKYPGSTPSAGIQRPTQSPSPIRPKAARDLP